MDMKWDINTNFGSRYPESTVVDVDDERVFFISKGGATHSLSWDKINDITVHIPEREWRITATLSGTFTMKVKARNADEACDKAPTVGVWMFDDGGDAIPMFTNLVEYEDSTSVRMTVEATE